MKTVVTILVILLTASGAFSQDGEKENEEDSFFDSFGLEGYGTINYFNFDWDTNPDKRNSVDLERFVLYPEYEFNDKLKFRGEIEFEHGGTGVTKEFDVFEEFGEFETEVEAGGEVLVEQLYVAYKINDALNFKLGAFKLPIGIQAIHDEPNEYFTTIRSPAEADIIPTNWYEMGVQVHGAVGAIDYTFSIVNGLDATGFSSANWIQRGNQGRFEMNNAENFAYTLRVDYNISDQIEIGTSGYIGNTADNRPKPDFNTNAYVALTEGHFIFNNGPLKANLFGLFGNLQNSDLVSAANRNLSNNLNVKRTPVAKQAVSWYGEIGYDISTVTKINVPLFVFGRYEFYDSMFDVVEGAVSDNARWERNAVTAGLNLFLHEKVVLKSQFTHRWLGFSNDNVENTFSTGLGFQF